MANATVELRASRFALVKRDRPSEVIDISGDAAEWLNRYSDKTIPEFLYTVYNSPPASIKNRRLYSIKAVFRCSALSGFEGAPGMEVAAKTINPETITWSNRPGRITDYYLLGPEVRDRDAELTMAGENLTNAQRSEFAAAFLKTLTTFAFCASYGETVKAVNVAFKLEDGTAPYIELTYDDSTNVKSKITPSNCPISGYVNPRTSTSFQWTFEKDDTYFCAGSFDQANATLHWREAGTSTWNDVAATGSNKSLSIPANTFPTAKTIEWYLSGTDTTGTASQTEVYSFSTAASLVTATAISPANTIESNNQPITFRWSYSSQDGFAPTRYLFRWKRETDADYTTLIDSTDVVNEHTFQANTFPTGTIQWVVIAYNIDGVPSGGSAKNFISYGAPEPPTVYATNVPFSKVSWQAEDQQGYEIKIDDTEYGPYFGTEKEFEVPEMLTDGKHVIRVRAIGTYGIWSEWGTTDVTVENEPGEEIVLSGEPGVENQLSWTTEEETADFLIYRNGVPIGRTTRKAFTDRFAGGSVRYQVFNRLTSGNYSASNEVEVNSTMNGSYIAELSGTEWLEIKLSMRDQRDPEYEDSAESFYDHLAGDIFPSATLSGYRDSKVSFSALFLKEQEPEEGQFRNLIGKPVILKLRDGTVFVGILEQWRRTVRKRFWTAYSFSVRRIEWEDYVDDTQ